MPSVRAWAPRRRASAAASASRSPVDATRSILTATIKIVRQTKYIESLLPALRRGAPDAVADGAAPPGPAGLRYPERSGTEGRPLAFGFYNRLSASRRRVYEHSDRLPAPRLPQATFVPLAAALRSALESERPAAVGSAAQVLADALVTALALPPVRIVVRRTRPERGGAEYHGYYEGAEGGVSATITLWMFTARRRQVVAFRTFLRTLVHELCHHLDFEGFALEESFHTEGFYAREASLFRDIVGERLGTSPRRQRA